MRLLGDEYVKAEFRAHREVENPVHIVSWDATQDEEKRVEERANGYQIGFLTEWQMYAQNLEGEKWIGETMDKGKIDKMSGECSISPGLEELD